MMKKYSLLPYIEIIYGVNGIRVRWTKLLDEQIDCIFHEGDSLLVLALGF